MVVIVPLLMPKMSCKTLATGARQFVVHEALETTLCFEGSYVLSFTPRTKVASGPSAGAEIITFFTGARRCFFASTPLVKRPVDSTTMSAPTDAQLISAGSFTLKTLKLLPSTAMVSSVCVTLCGRLPRTESYFKRCARVFASVMSLTATNWMSLSSSAVRMMLRPMRPKPLMPTLMGITSSDGVSEIAVAQKRITSAGEQKMLWVARAKVNARGNEMVSQFLVNTFIGQAGYFRQSTNVTQERSPGMSARPHLNV